MSATLSRDWTPEQQHAIDWGNAAEVLNHSYTLHALLDAHPKLQTKLCTSGAPSLELSRLFLKTDDVSRAEQKKHVQKWIKEKLFTPRAERWCRRCGTKGHTMTACSSAPPKRANPLERQRQRQQEFELKRQMEVAPRPDKAPEQGRKPRNVASVVDDTWYRGTVKFLDRSREFGEVQSPGDPSANPRYGFQFDRLAYGLKKVALNHEVRFRLERNGERTNAVDIRPMVGGLTSEDVAAFISDCDAGGVTPITQMRAILDQRHDWDELLRRVTDGDTVDRGAAVNVIVRMTTFKPNRDAINTSLLRAFLRLLVGGSGVTNFFPSVVMQVLPAAEAVAEYVASTPTAVDALMEVADLVCMLRALIDVPLAVAQPVGEHVRTLVDAFEAAGVKSPRKLAWVRATIDVALRDTVGVPLLPTAKDIAAPPFVEASPMHPSRLPVVASEPFADPEAHIRAHMELLRADTFNALTRIVAAACFDVDGVQPDKDTLEDVKHARHYDNVRFVARTCSKDRDQVDGYVFALEARGENVAWSHALPQGQFVCITTGQDRSVVDPGEVFWGVVGANDAGFIGMHHTVLHPFECDFSRLVDNLIRNEAADELDKSQLLESALFIHGYAPVQRALSAFIGVNAAELPMRDVIVAETPHPADTNVGMVPPWYSDAFDAVVGGVTKNLVLDPGQAATMDRLRTSPVTLVQGPPGTGKSFIGCRVVETIVRFKRDVASGAVMSNIDVSQLPDTSPESLTPSAGPVVVITYKNHALDEFLVDLQRSGLWCGKAREQGACRCTGCYIGCCPKCCDHVASMVRIGGRSSAPELQPYNINELMATKAVPRDVAQGRARVNILMRKSERIATEIRALEAGVVTANVFQAWLTTEQRSTIDHSKMDAWLRGEQYIGKDTAVANPYTARLRCAVQPLVEAVAVDEPADVAPADDDDGVQLSVLAAMRAETRETQPQRDLKQMRMSMVSRRALELGRHGPGAAPVDYATFASLWSLSPQQRHDCFVYNVESAIAQRVHEYCATIEQLETAVVLLDHARERARLDLIRDVDVVGLTTTGCAMQQNLLRSLKPSVLVVEEAAEILESQLLACMTDSLKQVVLIGDHYQLQPKVETLALERTNRMNISMFERLVKHLSPAVLTEQRRMRPHIADMVRPFYDTPPLADHASVKTRPFVDKNGVRYAGALPGLVHDVFMWTHDVPEEVAAVGRSKVNKRELLMTLSIVRHLVASNVRPASITVITPYLGQRRAINAAMKAISRDVRVSTVDRFQGDEADIIILSLVRTQALTEFIRMRNRMIVACSRARFASVIIGNDALLMGSPHWASVITALRQKKLVGPKLPVVSPAGETKDIPGDVPYSEWFGPASPKAAAAPAIVAAAY